MISEYQRLHALCMTYGNEKNILIVFGESRNWRR
jgi:hypothetical protein